MHKRNVDGNKMNQNKFLGIILSALLIVIILNYNYLTCSFIFSKKVCIYLKNKSGQSIVSGSLTAYKNDTIQFYQVRNNSATCLKYSSMGENEFTIFVKLADGTTLKYGPEYSEDSYGFDLTVTADKVYIESY